MSITLIMHTTLQTILVDTGLTRAPTSPKSSLLADPAYPGLNLVKLVSQTKIKLTAMVITYVPDFGPSSGICPFLTNPAPAQNFWPDFARLSRFQQRKQIIYHYKNENKL